MLHRLLCLLCSMVLSASLFAFSAGAEWTPLPMDDNSYGPAPREENRLSPTEYQDESIWVQLGEGRYAETTYHYAHIKIAHPSQLRTVPASVVYSDASPKTSSFRRGSSEDTARPTDIAAAVNAVVALNGDFYTKTEMVRIMLRQSTQIRNNAEHNAEAGSNLLIIDRDGNFSHLDACTKEAYMDYYNAHADEMYQVFCFGPVLVENGVSVISEDYRNNSIGSYKNTQRAAIAQLGELEYLLVVCYSDQLTSPQEDTGLTIQQFAALCEQLGKELSENGCMLAYNLDGGSSASLVFFDHINPTKGPVCTKVNEEKNRAIADMIYFATLVK